MGIETSTYMLPTSTGRKNLKRCACVCLYLSVRRTKAGNRLRTDTYTVLVYRVHKQKPQNWSAILTRSIKLLMMDAEPPFLFNIFLQLPHTDVQVYEVQHYGENGKPFGVLEGALNQKFLVFS